MLYQLYEEQFKRARNYVVINGPFDTYGKIISYNKETKIYLIRGVGHRKPV